MKFFTLEVPEFDGFVPTGRSNGFAVWAEGNAGNPFYMTPEGFDFFTLEVPQFDGIVSTGRSNGRTVWAEGDAIDRIFMPREGFEFFTLEIPEFDGIVITGRSNGRTVWAEGDAEDPFFMLIQPIILSKSFCINCIMQDSRNFNFSFLCVEPKFFS